MTRRRARSKGESHRWSHPLTVGVIVAAIGVAGTIGATLVGSSGSSTDGASETTRDAIASAPLAVQTVTFTKLANGWQRIAVVGIATRLSPGHSIYAVAQPADVGPAASDVASRESDDPRRGVSNWYASHAVEPDVSGQWVATIRAPPPPQALTVIAVVVPEPLPEGGGKEAHRDPDPDCSACSGSSSYTYRPSLKRRGPRADGVATSSPPVVARP